MLPGMDCIPVTSSTCTNKADTKTQHAKRHHQAYRYFEGVHSHLVLHGVQGRAADVAGGVADGVGLRGAPERHLGGGDGRLRGVLVVPVDAVERNQHGDDKAQHHCPCDHSLAHVITQLLCGPRRAS